MSDDGRPDKDDKLKKGYRRGECHQCGKICLECRHQTLCNDCICKGCGRSTLLCDCKRITDK